MRLLLIDNFDSFTFNLAQAFQQLGVDVSVRRNDALEAVDFGSEDFAQAVAERLVISPGPGSPGALHSCRRALTALRGRIPILGVCLGHQLLAEELGAQVSPSPPPVHGKKSWIRHRREGIFAALPDPFLAARYHSLSVVASSVPAALRATAWTDDGAVMALGVPGEATWGVQFHPESYMTPDGAQLLESFLEGTVCPE